MIREWQKSPVWRLPVIFRESLVDMIGSQIESPPVSGYLPSSDDTKPNNTHKNWHPLYPRKREDGALLLAVIAWKPWIKGIIFSLPLGNLEAGSSWIIESPPLRRSRRTGKSGFYTFRPPAALASIPWEQKFWQQNRGPTLDLRMTRAEWYTPKGYVYAKHFINKARNIKKVLFFHLG